MDTRAPPLHAGGVFHRDAQHIAEALAAYDAILRRPVLVDVAVQGARSESKTLLAFPQQLLGVLPSGDFLLQVAVRVLQFARA